MEKLDSIKIVNALKNHGVIAFPTETVMGLGVFYDDEIAFDKLNRIKGRPSNKPYTLMLSNIKNIEDFAYLNDLAKRIIDSFMPGPITILLKAKPNVPDWVDLKTGIIGVRVPNYELTLNVLKAAGKPLLVPSANKSGEVPTLNSKEVNNVLGEELDYIINGEAGREKPSTIIDLTNEEIRIVREGPITKQEIENKLGEIL